ncbi:Ni/Fe hydrogenase [Nitrosomonas sp.]|uniref:Ni/Fe hydrogenase n=1 Tax=Nitrosomonas sp. TaxID=42353 RepID=UPI0025EFD4B0|nr:Ni/Fe hydrogenase [Nitrosomonas sp.]
MTKSISKPIPRLLLFGYGNPGRGDDVLGPLFVEKVIQLKPKRMNCQRDMQLLVEHVTDLDEHEQTLFVDADMSCAEPFEFSTVSAQKDASYTSHALTPEALLYVYQQVYKRGAPEAFLLRIRGYHFALGNRISHKAVDNLNVAIQFFCQRYMPRP